MPRSGQFSEERGLALLENQVIFILMERGVITVLGSWRVRRDNPCESHWLWPIRVSDIAKKVHRSVSRNNFFYEGYRRWLLPSSAAQSWLFCAAFFADELRKSYSHFSGVHLPWFLHFLSSQFTHFFIYLSNRCTGCWDLNNEKEPLKIRSKYFQDYTGHEEWTLGIF